MALRVSGGSVRHTKPNGPAVGSHQRVSVVLTHHSGKASRRACSYLCAEPDKHNDSSDAERPAEQSAQPETPSTSPSARLSTLAAPQLPLVRPRVTYALLAINLSVYAAGIAIALLDSGEASNEFFLLLAKINEEVAAGQYWRLLTANFMHAGLLHLGLNIAALYFIAPEAEAVLGYAPFAAIYLLAGLSGSVASYLLTDLTTVGASGALFGLLGALVAYFVKNPKLERAGQQVFYIFGILGFNILLGLDEGGMVDNTGHLAGFAAGLWLGAFLAPRWEAVPVDAIPQNSQSESPDPAGGSIAVATGSKPSQDSTSARTDSADSADAGAQTSSSRSDAATASTADSPTLALLSQLLADVEEAGASGKQAPTSSALSAVQSAAADMLAADQGATAGAARGQAMEYKDVGRRNVRKAVVATFVVSLVVLTWAGTASRGIGPPGLSL